MLGRLFRVLIFLIVLGFAGLTGYAYLGDLSPDLWDVSQPVDIDVE